MESDLLPSESDRAQLAQIQYIVRQLRQPDTPEVGPERALLLNAMEKQALALRYTRPAFQAGLATGELYETVRALVHECGDDPETILAELWAWSLRLRSEGREADEETVLDVMDRIVGWCSPAKRI